MYTALAPPSSLCCSYFLPTVVLQRKYLCERAGAFDKWTSLGNVGYRALVRTCYKTFHLDDLDLHRDLERRGVATEDDLPGYLYRNDALKLRGAISAMVENVLTCFYECDDDVRNDTELFGWISVSRGEKHCLVENKNIKKLFRI